MTCKEIQDVILTDYLDGELHATRQKLVEDHIASCQACREFAAVAKKTTLDPLTHSKTATPPEYLWPRIQEAITQTEQEPQKVGIVERLRRLSLFQKPVLAISTLTAMVFVVFYLFVFLPTHSNHSQVAQSDVGDDPLEYFVILQENESSDMIDDLGTDIEAYFL